MVQALCIEICPLWKSSKNNLYDWWCKSCAYALHYYGCLLINSYCSYCSRIGRTVPLLKPPQSSHCYLHEGEAGQRCCWEQLCRCGNVTAAGFLPPEFNAITTGKHARYREIIQTGLSISRFHAPLHIFSHLLAQRGLSHTIGITKLDPEASKPIKPALGSSLLPCRGHPNQSETSTMEHQGCHWPLTRLKRPHPWRSQKLARCGCH